MGLAQLDGPRARLGNDSITSLRKRVEKARKAYERAQYDDNVGHWEQVELKRIWWELANELEEIQGNEKPYEMGKQRRVSGHQNVIQGPLYDFGQDYFINNLCRGPRYDAPVIGGTGDLSNDQRMGAARLLIQNNVHGIATHLAAQNQNTIFAKWAAKGGNPTDLANDIKAGASKPVAASLGAAGVWPPVLGTAQFYANNTGAPFTGPNTTGPSTNNIFLNQLYSSITTGQDANGYYGWWDSTGTFWSGSDADSELRTAYQQAGQWWGGIANISMGAAGGPTIPAPKAIGADKNPKAPLASPTALQDIAAAAGPSLNILAPGAGTALNALVGNNPNAILTTGGTTIPTQQQVPVAIVSSNTGLYIGLGAAAVAVGLFFAFSK